MDLNEACAKIQIVSAFATVRRIRSILSILEARIKQGVVVCVFIQEPREWSQERETLQPEVRRRIGELESVLELLRGAGVHVTLRKDLHEKVAVIDGCILWEGSLNILSHRSTKERMRRIPMLQECHNAIRDLGLDSCNECGEKYLTSEIKTRRKISHKGDNMDDDVIELLERVMQERLRLQMPQSEIAKRSGLGQGRLSEIESNKRAVTLPVLMALAKALRHKLVLVPMPLVSSVNQQIMELHDKQRRVDADGHRKSRKRKSSSAMIAVKR